jgi:hypothetical protein
MAHLNGIRSGTLSHIVRRNWRLGAGPLGENAEEAGDVVGHLAGVLSVQVTPETSFPDFARPVD